MRKGLRRRGTRLICPRCLRDLPVSSFFRCGTICRKCLHATPVRPDPGVTIRLGGDRVLRVRRLADVLVVSQGFRLVRPTSEAVSTLSRIHLPLTRVAAVQRALERFAPAP
jgi:hypothetical protein